MNSRELKKIEKSKLEEIAQVKELLQMALEAYFAVYEIGRVEIEAVLTFRGKVEVREHRYKYEPGQ